MRRHDGLEGRANDGVENLVLTELHVRTTSPRSWLASPNAVKVSLNSMLGSQIAECKAVNGFKKEAVDASVHAAPWNAG